MIGSQPTNHRDECLTFIGTGPRSKFIPEARTGFCRWLEAILLDGGVSLRRIGKAEQICFRVLLAERILQVANNNQFTGWLVELKRPAVGWFGGARCECVATHKRYTYNRCSGVLSEHRFCLQVLGKGWLRRQIRDPFQQEHRARCV